MSKKDLSTKESCNGCESLRESLTFSVDLIKNNGFAGLILGVVVGAALVLWFKLVVAILVLGIIIVAGALVLNEESFMSGSPELKTPVVAKKSRVKAKKKTTAKKSVAKKTKAKTKAKAKKKR